MKKCLLLIVAVAMLLSACSVPGGGFIIGPAEGTAPPETGEVPQGAVSLEELNPEELFSDRDYKTGYDELKSAVITLNGSGISCTSDAVKIDGTTATVTGEGTYVVRGSLDDGMIVVDAAKEDKVQLVLDGASITSQTCAAIYILQADKVFLTLLGENHLENGGSFQSPDENNIDAVIFSKEDLTMNGTGSLTIVSPGGHGVVSKDELTITGGSYSISCGSHGLSGKDCVSIAGGELTVVSGKDGIQAENEDEEALGFVYIQDGAFHITADGDGISASSAVQIDGGNFRILCGGGAANGEQHSSGMGFGGMGGRPGRPGDRGQSTQQTQTDTTSTKGIKAASDLLINGGSFDIDAADDALHSNANLTVAGGSFLIATGDDGFHGDKALAILSGTIQVTESYEGLEGLSITVSGGEIRLCCSDDGLNAAGGTDRSGFGNMGGRPGDRFGGSGSSDSFILISGGNLYINASGDGIDSNGSLTISGGFTTVCGPTQGDTAVLDYDSTGIITGGTFIGTGSYMMAQTFSDSEQGVIALSVGNQSAGTPITLGDDSGKLLVDYTPELNYAIVIISTPDMVKGQTYSITVGRQSGDFSAN